MAPGPQLGHGSVAIYGPDGSGPYGFIASHYSASYGFRELIVAYKGALFVPIKVKDYDLRGMVTSYGDPKDAEEDFLEQLGLPSAGDADRWWVESHSVNTQTSYPDPNASFGLYQAYAGADASGDISLVCAHFMRGASSGVLELDTYLSRPSGKPVDIDPDDVALFSSGNPMLPTGKAFNAYAMSLMNDPSMGRWTIEEKLGKLTSGVPTSWNVTLW